MMNILDNKLTIRMTKECFESFGVNKFVDNVEIKIVSGE